jgi:hypothetical protein
MTNSIHFSVKVTSKSLSYEDDARRAEEALDAYAQTLSNDFKFNAEYHQADWRLAQSEFRSTEGLPWSDFVDHCESIAHEAATRDWHNKNGATVEIEFIVKKVKDQ